MVKVLSKGEVYIHAEDTQFLTDKIAKLEAENQRLRNALEGCLKNFKLPHQVHAIAKQALEDKND